MRHVLLTKRFSCSLLCPGKSTLARNLQPHWHWLDSEAGKLNELLVGANKLLRRGQRVAIDRCNVTRDERLHILQQLSAGVNVACVWFDVAETTCLPRVLSRRGHATLTEAKLQRKGKEFVARMLSGFAQRLQPPSLDEGYSALHVVNDDASLQAVFAAHIVDTSAGRKTILLDDGSTLLAEPEVLTPTLASQPPDTTRLRSAIIKYPQTPHLLATGGSALSTDDLLLSPAQSRRFVGPEASVVLVQEKVDGANIGLTLMADWSVAVQNRAHYVTAATHAQFSALPQWIEQHKAELNDLLAPPGRYTVALNTTHRLLPPVAVHRHATVLSLVSILFSALSISCSASGAAPVTPLRTARCRTGSWRSTCSMPSPAASGPSPASTSASPPPPSHPYPYSRSAATTPSRPCWTS